MAIYHLHVNIFSRSAGRSATSAIAYLAGSLIVDERTGETFDYTSLDGASHVEMVLPDSAPAEYRDSSTFWNAVEQAEKRKNSSVAREFEFSLPHELSHEQQVELARNFAKHLCDRHRFGGEFAIHKPPKKGLDQRNVHCHFLTSTRRVNAGGIGEKCRELDSRSPFDFDGKFQNSKEWLRQIRKDWEDFANAALKANGIDARIDCRTLAEQGIDRIPQIHLGSSATAMVRRGAESDRAKINDEIIKLNSIKADIKKDELEIEKMNAKLNHLKKQINPSE